MKIDFENLGFIALMLFKIFFFCSIVALVASFVMGFAVSAWDIFKVIIGLWVLWAGIVVFFALVGSIVVFFEKIKRVYKENKGEI